MTMKDTIHAMKLSAPVMAATPAKVRNQALLMIAEALQAESETLYTANEQDVAKAEADSIPSAVLGRLHFDEKKLSACVEGLKQLAGLDDPIGRVLLKRELDEGLTLTRIAVPIGVIGVIFEARPDALVQIAGLCIKSGNCAVLKGGKEAGATNRALFTCIRDTAVKAGLPENCLLQVSAHEEIDELLKLDNDVDLIIPRGSNAFVRHIMENTKIPVMGHAAGICHIYVDRAADRKEAIRVILDAKTQYPSACNAVETVLVHREIAPVFLPELSDALKKASVRVHADADVKAVVPTEGAPLTDADYSREYGDLELAVRLVDDVEEAIAHINRYGSHHTDAILTKDDAAADRFFALVDSAGVYRNCSTRFADGFRYGFGAEVGISTGKIHARGPVGLEGLTTYRYILSGNGQTVGDYVDGTKSFHFRDL